MERDGGDSFLVGYQGQLISCGSLSDAVALKRAAQILTDPTPPETTLRELMRLADLLTDCELHDDAERMRDISRRTRALQFLVYSRGYVRPKRKRALARESLP
jgi:hypothetical protein